MTTQLDVGNDFQRGFGTDASPTWRQLAAKDALPVPEVLLKESPPNLGSEPLLPIRYTSYDYHRQEVEKIWKRVWQMACREEEIPQVGDHFIYDVAGMSYVIVRVAEDSFKAYHNVCLHRGRQLVDCSGKGAKQFKCAYHAWTWNIDGSLAFFPGKWDFPGVSPETYGLKEVKLERWGGFVFINPDPNAEPLTKQLGGMAKHFEISPLDKRFTLWHVRKTINSNWKVAIEAFLESYHLAMTHPQALPSVAEHGTQYDLWEEEGAAYSRSITPSAVPSYHSRDGSPEGAIADMWALVNGLRMDEAPPLPEEIHDRASLAAWRRKNLGEMTRADYSEQCDAMMLDSIQYWMFPNFCPWMGEGLPLTYLFRPNTDSPDTCYMDAWMLVRSPDSGSPPPAPAMIELGPNDRFEPHIGAMGLIFDQDDFNMPQVHAGMKGWPDILDGLTLGRYQESRVRFLHEMVEKWINAK